MWQCSTAPCWPRACSTSQLSLTTSPGTTQPPVKKWQTKPAEYWYEERRCGFLTWPRETLENTWPQWGRVAAESEVKLLCWPSHFYSRSRNAPFSPHFHQNTNMVLQTVHWAGGGPTVCGMRKAEKNWPATYKQSSWHAVLPSECLYHQAGQLQRHLLHYVVQSECWESHSHK